MTESKTIVFFPEATFGPSMNCVGIAQRLRERGHKPVFVADSSFKGVFEKFGFPERMVAMSEPMDEAAASQYWRDFIAAHLPNFKRTAIEQIPNYVLECWDTIVDTSVFVQEELAEVLADIRPDLICLDNCIMFPAIKRAGCPWVRIVSCSENEIPDPDIPVRRHIIWNKQRPDLKEDLAHLVQYIRRRICGVASAGSPSFSV